MTTLRSKKGNDRTIIVTITDSNGSAIDITGYTINFWLGLDGTEKFTSSFILTDPTNGIAQVVLSDTELNIAAECYDYYIHMIDTTNNDTTIAGGVFELLDRYDEQDSNTSSFSVTAGTTDNFNITITSTDGVDNFLDLTDTPASYSSQALKFLRVNAGEDAIEFTTSSASVDSLGDIGDVTITSIASGEILKWNGSAWVNNTLTEAGVLADPMTTRGDIIIRDASNNTERLAVGSNGQVLTSDGTDVSWSSVAGGGDVTGPASAVDDNLATFNGTTGKIIQDGGQSVSGVLSRANHTGTQTASTISDFDTEVSNNSSVTANTAKVTNATHTGEVTGSGALTIASGVVDVDNLAATGTPSSATFLRGDDTWATPAGSGDVSKVGTPVDNQVGVWTGDGTIEGTTNLTYDGSNLQLTGDIGSTGTRITKGWFIDLQVTNAISASITGNSATVSTITGLAPDTATTAAAQPNITSLGTLTTLSVDNITINGNDISSTGGTDLTITPLAGQQLVLDSTIIIDAGVMTGATSITSTAFVGDLTGNADTVTNFTPASGSLTLSGADALTLTTSATTNVTLPTTGTLMANVVEDTTPQLGGNLDGQANDISVDTGQKLILNGPGGNTYLTFTGSKVELYVGGVKKQEWS
jgi:hypothetical protein